MASPKPIHAPPLKIDQEPTTHYNSSPTLSVKKQKESRNESSEFVLKPASPFRQSALLQLQTQKAPRRRIVSLESGQQARMSQLTTYTQSSTKSMSMTQPKRRFRSNESRDTKQMTRKDAQKIMQMRIR